MISMQEAEARVSRRMGALIHDGEEVTTIGAGVTTTAGTDVDAEALGVRIYDDVRDLMTLTVAGEDAAGPGILAGGLMRIFWLGFELGRGECS